MDAADDREPELYVRWVRLCLPDKNADPTEGDHTVGESSSEEEQPAWAAHKSLPKNRRGVAIPPPEALAARAQVDTEEAAPLPMHTPFAQRPFGRLEAVWRGTDGTAYPIPSAIRDMIAEADAEGDEHEDQADRSWTPPETEAEFTKALREMANAEYTTDQFSRAEAFMNAWRIKFLAKQWEQKSQALQPGATSKAGAPSGRRKPEAGASSSTGP